MSFLIREKGIDTSKPHIVKRNTDGKYAIRYVRKDGIRMYLTLYGNFNSGRIDKLIMLTSRRDWISEEYQRRTIGVDDNYSEWTNNIRALKKVLNYREDIME